MLDELLERVAIVVVENVRHQANPRCPPPRLEWRRGVSFSGREEGMRVAADESVQEQEPARTRILIGLTEIAGYAGNLRAGFDALGVEAETLNLQPNYFDFAGDRPATALQRALQRVSRARLRSRPGSLRRRFLAGAQVVVQPLALLEALRRYDVFVFLYDTSFLRQRELPLLKRFGKKAIYVFCGSDDRPAYLDGGQMAALGGVEECLRRVERQKRMLRRVERWADVVITNPSHGQLHERPFVSFPVVGIPRVLGEMPAGTERGGPVRILHAPTHPQAKGTETIVATVETLRKAGHPVELDVVRGVSNREFRERLAGCDLVVDQVWADTQMDGVTADAALAGKPTVIGGYGWQELDALFPPEALPPSARCRPEELGETIARLVEDAEERHALGQAARAFVETRWNAAAVARRILDLLDADPPPGWVVDPARLPYVLGWGQSAERSAEVVAAVVAQGGVGALGLADKPSVERAVAALVELKTPEPVAVRG
jgi:Glycosyl transferases group 1